MNITTDISTGTMVRFNENGKKWWKEFRPSMNCNLVMEVKYTCQTNYPNEARRVVVKRQKGLPCLEQDRTFSPAHLELPESTK